MPSYPSEVSTVVRSSTDAGVVVAYEADRLDPERRTSWSAVVRAEGTLPAPGVQAPLAAST